jgi:hypothetical protein
MSEYRTETQLVNDIIHRLNAAGNFVWRNNSGAVRSMYTDRTGRKKERFWRAGVKGGSDILGIARDGKFIAIECKNNKYKATPAQLEFIKEIKDRDGYAVIAYGISDIPRQLF